MSDNETEAERERREFAEFIDREFEAERKAEQEWRESEAGRAAIAMIPERATLYWVHSQVANFHGYKNVWIAWFMHKRPRQLFGPEGSLGVPYAAVIRGYDEADESGRLYCEGAVEERFTIDEARSLVDWLREHRDDDAKLTTVDLPFRKNCMGVGAQAVGGETDFYMISKNPDYDLPFEVFGFYDVKRLRIRRDAPGSVALLKRA